MTLQERDDMIVDFFPYAQRLARGFSRSYNVDAAECTSVASEALVNAATHYVGPIADSGFQGYARRAIWNKLVDELLKFNPTLNRHTHRSYALYRAYQRLLSTNGTMTKAAAAEILSVPLARLERAISVIEFEPLFFSTTWDDFGDDAPIAARLAATTAAPDVLVERAAEIVAVRAALAALPTNQQDAITATMDGEQATYARRRGVSRQRVSQLYLAGLKRLRERNDLREWTVAA